MFYRIEDYEQLSQCHRKEEANLPPIYIVLRLTLQNLRYVKQLTELTVNVTDGTVYYRTENKYHMRSIKVQFFLKMKIKQQSDYTLRLRLNGI